MTAEQEVLNWIETCRDRFRNMYEAKLDENGYPAINSALKNYLDRGYFTVGEVQYLFNRTHPLGAIPKYNTHKGYNKIHGNMRQCPIPDLVNSGMVNWRTGQNGVMQAPFAQAIKAETRWEFRAGNLRPQQMTSFSDLFN